MQIYRPSISVAVVEISPSLIVNACAASLTLLEYFLRTLLNWPATEMDFYRFSLFALNIASITLLGLSGTASVWGIAVSNYEWRYSQPLRHTQSTSWGRPWTDCHWRAEGQKENPLRVVVKTPA
jgi:hypothetical protein